MDPIEFWREIEYGLEGKPQSEDMRMRLLRFVRCINTAVVNENLKPEQAAQRITDIVGLSGSVIKAYRDAKRAELIGMAFELKRREIKAGTCEGQVKALAAELAEIAGVSTGHIYRWGAQAAERLARDFDR